MEKISLLKTEVKAKDTDLRFKFCLEFGISANALSYLNILIDSDSVYCSSLCVCVCVCVCVCSFSIQNELIQLQSCLMGTGDPTVAKL